jgi:hypothetical protein
VDILKPLPIAAKECPWKSSWPQMAGGSSFGCTMNAEYIAPFVLDEWAGGGAI